MKVTAITRYKHGDIFELLEKLGWTQADLARRSGISQTALGKIINLQRRPSFEQANCIQRAFGEVGVYFDVLEHWPETFEGTKKAVRLIQTKEVNMDFLLEHQTQLLLGDKSGVDIDALRPVLEETMEGLSKREKEILGLFAEGLTLREIGEKFGIGHERVRQIEARALRKMRHPERAKKLEEFLPYER